MIKNSGYINTTIYSMDNGKIAFVGAFGLIQDDPSIGCYTSPSSKHDIPERHMSLDGSLLDELFIPSVLIESDDIEDLRAKVLKRINSMFDHCNEMKASKTQ